MPVCTACNDTGVYVAEDDICKDEGVTISFCEHCQPGLWTEDWGRYTVMGKIGIIARLADSVECVYDEGNADFRPYLQGVIDALDETFGDAAVDELLEQLSAPVRRDWIAAARGEY